MPRSPYGRPGFVDLGKSVAESVLRYLDARVLLFQIESREASANFARRAILIVCSLLFLASAYFIGLTAGISLAASHFETRWEYVALAAAAGHLALGILAFLVARARFSKPLFQSTLKELEKDRQWLQERK